MLGDLLTQDEVLDVTVHCIGVGDCLDDVIGGVGYGVGGGVDGDRFYVEFHFG